MEGETAKGGLKAWKQSEDPPEAPYSPLLFRQIAVLAFICGIMALRLPLAGLLALAVLIASAPERAQKLHPLLLLALCFLFGLAYSYWRMPQTTPLFSGQSQQVENNGDGLNWAHEAITPGGAFYRQGLKLSGKVEETDALPGGRLRIILGEVRPLAPAGKIRAEEAVAWQGLKLPAENLPGRLVLTWQSPPGYLSAEKTAANSIIPGLTLTAELKPRPIRNFYNQGGMDAELYWRERETWTRAWIYGEQPSLLLEGEPGFFAGLRENARRKVYAALPKKAASHEVNEADGPKLKEEAPQAEEEREEEPPRSFSDRLVPGAEFIPALLLGDRFGLGPDTLDLFSRATLSHSLALSGLHLGYAATLGYLAGRIIFMLLQPLLARYGKAPPARRKCEILMALPPAVAYIWLGGASPSLLRAGLMLFFWGLLLWLERPAVLLDGLLWAVSLILLFDPLALFDLRLQLSALSICAIALATPWLGRLARKFSFKPRKPGLKLPWPRRIANRMLQGLIYMLGISLAAQLALLPFSLSVFGLVGLAWPLNALWLPVLGLAVMPAAFAGLAAALSGFVQPAEALFSLAARPCAELLRILNFLQSNGLLPAPEGLRPLWSGVAGFWILLLGLALVLHYRSRRGIPPKTLPFLLLAGFALLCAGPFGRVAETRDDFVRLHALDVGQGQSLLLEWSDKGRLRRLLFDGGGVASATFDTGRDIILPLLTRNQPPSLDFIVSSHNDYDHLRGLIHPVKALRTEVYADNGAAPPAAGPGYQAAADMEKALPRGGVKHREQWFAPMRIELSPSLILEVLHPYAAETLTRSGNRGSLVLRLVRRGRPLALFCADAENVTLNALLDRLAASGGLEAPVLILPHHGSARSYNKAFYAAVDPKIAIACCGYGNRWNFPSARVREAMLKRGAAFLSTAENGMITLEWKDAADSPKIRLARGAESFILTR